VEIQIEEPSPNFEFLPELQNMLIKVEELLHKQTQEIIITDGIIEKRNALVEFSRKKNFPLVWRNIIFSYFRILLLNPRTILII